MAHARDCLSRTDAADRVGRAALGDIAARGVTVPRHVRSNQRPGQAHIGVGVFHRGHQAVYAADLLDLGWDRAAIHAVAMHSGDVCDALAGQEQLYTVGTFEDGDEPSCRVVDSIAETSVLADAPADVVERLTDPAIEVVTVTVTEAGYHWSPDQQGLDRDSSPVRHDLDHPDHPATMPGLLTAALARRRARGDLPFTIVPCDNIVGNGSVVRRTVAEFASTLDASLGSWIDHDVPFCSTMVDRMVPAPTPEHRARINERLGVTDLASVATEPFRQWVLQPGENARLPPWADVGVEIVDDVAPYETLKLRALNAVHTALASVGLLGGETLISNALATPAIRSFADALLTDEILPSIAAPPGVDLRCYADTVLSRFANPSLGYTTTKVASDGSAKIAQRLVPVIRDSLNHGRPVERTAFVVAAWLWCLAGPRPETPEVTDPLADRLVVDDARGDHDAAIDRLLDERDVLGEVADAPVFVDALRRQAGRIWSHPDTAVRDIAERQPA